MFRDSISHFLNIYFCFILVAEIQLAKKTFLFILVLKVTIVVCCSQTIAGSEAAGIANNAVCLKGAFATFNNPAALFNLEKLQAGLQIQRRFNVDILHSNLSVAFPIKGVTAGVGIDNFGNRLYNENVIQTALANKIAARTGVGIAAQWVHFSSLVYGNRNRFAFQLGFVHGFNSKLKFGLNIKNIALQKGFLASENRETSAQVGVEYQQNENVKLYITLGGSTIYQSFGAIGLQYKANEYLTGRIGFSTGNEPVSAGFGLKLNKMMLNVAVKVHNKLGASPEISLIYPAN